MRGSLYVFWVLFEESCACSGSVVGLNVAPSIVPGGVLFLMRGLLVLDLCL